MNPCPHAYWLAVKSIVLSMAVIALTACSSGQSIKHETGPATLRDVAWVAGLVGQSPQDASRVCLDSSLQTAFALLAFRDGNYADKAIESALLDKLPNDKVRALRKADSAEWLRTHEPSAVAANHFNLCLANVGNALPTSDIWLRCFLSTEPAAVLSIYKRSVRPLSSAVQAVIPYYPINANASDIAALAKQVYAMETDSADLQLREEIFVGCLARKQ